MSFQNIDINDIDNVLNEVEEEDLVEENQKLTEELNKSDEVYDFMIESNSESKDSEKNEENKSNENNEENNSDSCEISEYDDVKELEPILENKIEENKNTEKRIGETTINGIKAEIVVSDSKTEKLSDEEVQKKQLENKDKFIKQAKNKAAKLLKDHDFYKFNIEELIPGKETYMKNMSLLFGNTIIPDENVQIELEKKIPINTESYVRGISGFSNYKVFDIPHEPVIHSLPEMILIIKKCNKLFDYEFADTKDTNFKMDGLDDKISKFIYKYKDLSSTIYDHRLIISLLGKLEILLSTSVERNLKTNAITITPQFYRACGPYLKQMKCIQSDTGILAKSWKLLYESLFGINPQSKNLIFNFDSTKYQDFNEILKTVYLYNKKEIDYDQFGQMEVLFANTLKCYSPHMILCYFFLLRTIYFAMRLFAIYVLNEKFKDKNQETIAKDLSNIFGLAVIIYEQKYYVWKSSARIPVSVREGSDSVTDSTPQTQQLLDNFIVCGGQYYILKAFESAFPAISYQLFEGTQESK